MELTHLNEQGRGRMVDVSDKADTVRTATACGFVSMAPATAQLIRDGGIAKGDVLRLYYMSYDNERTTREICAILGEQTPVLLGDGRTDAPKNGER